MLTDEPPAGTLGSQATERSLAATNVDGGFEIVPTAAQEHHTSSALHFFPSISGIFLKILVLLSSLCHLPTCALSFFNLSFISKSESSTSQSSNRKNVEDFTGPRERSDLGFITFDITADLENIFDWNVKQLFLYLSAEYSTKNNALNQVVLWDKIVLRGDNPKLLLKDMKTKYFFFDDGNGLKGNRNVTLTLSWNVVPNAGILPLVTGSGHVSVPFPDTYEITKSY
nr:signal peptidase complex subunit 3 [Vicugna pacos]